MCSSPEQPATVGKMFTRASQDMQMVADQLASAPANDDQDGQDTAKKYRLRVAQQRAADAEAIAREATIAAEDAATKAAELQLEADEQAAHGKAGL